MTPAARAAWVHGQPMAPCPKCGSYNMKPQMPIQMELTGSETVPQVLGKWARYWFWRKWCPVKCCCCGRRWRHDETKDHLPF